MERRFLDSRLTHVAISLQEGKGRGVGLGVGGPAE